MAEKLSEEAKAFGFTEEHVKQLAAFLRQLMEGKPGEVVSLHMESSVPEKSIEKNEEV